MPRSIRTTSLNVGAGRKLQSNSIEIRLIEGRRCVFHRYREAATVAIIISREIIYLSRRRRSFRAVNLFLITRFSFLPAWRVLKAVSIHGSISIVRVNGRLSSVSRLSFYFQLFPRDIARIFHFLENRESFPVLIKAKLNLRLSVFSVLIISFFFNLCKNRNRFEGLQIIRGSIQIKTNFKL